MKTHISIGSTKSFSLSEALLIYRSTGNQESFVTLHRVEHSKEEKRALPPTLGPAETLTYNFVEQLTRSLGGSFGVEIFPETILARTPQLLGWWVPAQTRQMFFEHAHGILAEVNGKRCPQPALVMRVTAQGLAVRALTRNERPGSTTQLKVAPYWNTYESGAVCLGSMRAPKETTVASITDWERSFYESAFTHPSDLVRLTAHPGSSEGLWKELAGGRRKFPAKYLVDAKQTLAQFLRGDG